MYMRNTLYAFILLLLLSWILEFVLGIALIRWFWGTTWYDFGAPGQHESMSATIADTFNFTMVSYGRLKEGGAIWTAEGVITVVIGFFVVVHILAAIRWGLLDPLLQRWRLGARRPSQREQELFDQAYMQLARGAGGPAISRPRVWRVADGMGLQSRWIGYVLIIDRELLRHKFFSALLAHELGHANAEDRLARRLYAMLPPTVGIVGIMGGFAFAIGHVLLYPLWAWYWRERIYAADAFAAKCGQGHNLITALEFYQKLDKTTRGGRILKPVPYIETRIDRLQRLIAI